MPGPKRCQQKWEPVLRFGNVTNNPKIEGTPGCYGIRQKLPVAQREYGRILPHHLPKAERQNSLRVRLKKLTPRLMTGEQVMLSLRGSARWCAARIVRFCASPLRRTIRKRKPQVLVFGVISNAMILFVRSFLSHSHNAIVYKRHQNTLLACTSLTDAADEVWKWAHQHSRAKPL